MEDSDKELSDSESDEDEEYDVYKEGSKSSWMGSMVSEHEILSGDSINLDEEE